MRLMVVSRFGLSVVVSLISDCVSHDQAVIKTACAMLMRCIQRRAIASSNVAGEGIGRMHELSTLRYQIGE